MDSYYVSLTGIGESCLVKEELAEREVKENEALIKVEYSLISAGTELSRAYGLKKGFSYPVKPGYSAVGRIIKKGKDIKAEVGDYVFVNGPHSSLFYWTNEDNAQAPFILKLPEGIDPIKATTINIMLVAIQGVNLSEVKLGDSVVIFGLGNIGLITALMYKLMGCKVIGIDKSSGRRKLALEMGIDYVFDSDDYYAEIKKLTDNKGSDIVVDVTGLSEVIKDSLKICRDFGQLVLLGSPRQDYDGNLTEVFSYIHMHNIKVIGAFNNSAPMHAAAGSNNSVMRNVSVISDILINNLIDMNKLITKVIDPKDCKEAYYELMYKKEDVNLIVYDWRNY